MILRVFLIVLIILLFPFFIILDVVLWNSFYEILVPFLVVGEIAVLGVLIKVYKDTKKNVLKCFNRHSYVSNLVVLKAQLDKKNIGNKLNGEILSCKGYKIIYIDEVGELKGSSRDDFLELNGIKIPNLLNKSQKGIILKKVGLNYNVEGIKVLDMSQIYYEIEKTSD